MRAHAVPLSRVSGLPQSETIKTGTACAQRGYGDGCSGSSTRWSSRWTWSPTAGVGSSSSRGSAPGAGRGRGARAVSGAALAMTSARNRAAGGVWIWARPRCTCRPRRGGCRARGTGWWSPPCHGRGRDPGSPPRSRTPPRGWSATPPCRWWRCCCASRGARCRASSPAWSLNGPARPTGWRGCGGSGSGLPLPTVHMLCADLRDGWTGSRNPRWPVATSCFEPARRPRPSPLHPRPHHERHRGRSRISRHTPRHWT